MFGKQKMQLFDRATTSTPRRTTDGYLVADVRVARTGIQEYLGSELGKPDMPIVRVYRPESAVFSADAMHSYAHRPVTNDHPATQVTADTWRDVAVGGTGGEVVRDGEFVRVPLVLMDGAAIADYESGKRELSMGYDAKIEFINGVTDSGEQYDAIVTSMKMNHLALVNKARGGSELRIGDSPSAEGLSGQDKGGRMATEMKKVLVDGLTVETTEQGAQAIGKLQKDLADSASTMQALKDAHAAALAQKDAEIDALKAKVLTDAQIEARAIARADLLAKAKMVHDAEGAGYAGKTDSEIRRAVVVAKLGDAAVAGKADAYIDARFDILVEDASSTDPVRQAISDSARAGATQMQDAATQARAQYYDYLQNAHKGSQK